MTVRANPPSPAKTPVARQRTAVPALPAGGLWPRREALLVAAAALALRLLYWFLFSRTPFFRHPVIDGSFFDLWAQAIAAGREFQPDVWLKPPLYAYFLGTIYKLFGHAPVLAYAVQTLLGVADALLVLAIGRLVFTPRVARIGALAAALLPVLPFLELQLVAEALTTFLSLVALLLLLLARGSAGWRTGRLAAAGLLLGIAATGRPNALLVLPAAAWWVWLVTAGGDKTGGDKAGGGTPRWRPALTFLLAGLVALTPPLLRNWSVGHVVVPVSANFGVNLWTGHGPGADGTSAVPVGLHWDQLQVQSLRAGAHSVAAVSDHLGRLAWAEIAAHPLRAAGLMGRKALALVSAQEVRNNIGPSFLARQYGVAPLARWWPGFWLLGPFALLGLARRRRWSDPSGLLVLYVLALVLSVLPFFVNARFRAPMLPVAALFAAAAADDLIARWRSGGARAALPLLGALLGLALLVNVDWLKLDTPRNEARDRYNLAMAYSARLGGGGRGTDAGGWRAQDPQFAREQFARAMTLDPDEADYPEGYGQMLLELAHPLVERAANQRAAGDRAGADASAAQARPLLEEAATLHRRAGGLLPNVFSEVNLASALLWLSEGETGDAAVAHLREAAAACESALRRDPGLREAADNLAVARQRLQAAGAR